MNIEKTHQHIIHFVIGLFIQKTKVMLKSIRIFIPFILKTGELNIFFRRKKIYNNLQQRPSTPYKLSKFTKLAYKFNSDYYSTPQWTGLIQVPGEERQACLSGDPSSSICIYCTLLLLLKYISIYLSIQSFTLLSWRKWLKTDHFQAPEIH